MKLAWHYTTGNLFKLIVEDGFILPAATAVFPPERPIVWFSINQQFELTARKWQVSKDGTSRILSVQETRKYGGGLVRFGLDSRRLMPWKGGCLRKAAVMSYTIAKKLEHAGIAQGANPFEWFGSLDVIPISKCVIEVMDASGKWVEVPQGGES